MSLHPAERARWERDGFFVRPRFAARAVTDAMLDAAISLRTTLPFEGKLLPRSICHERGTKQ